MGEVREVDRLALVDSSLALRQGEQGVDQLLLVLALCATSGRISTSASFGPGDYGVLTVALQAAVSRICAARVRGG